MKYLIAGLGNIGPEYELSRHNIGFLVLDELADQQKVSFSLEKQAFKSEFKYRGRQVHLIKPTTYMNLSGRALNFWMNELKVSKENVLIITDDLALPFGKLRMRAKGSNAGHNGLKNIEEILGGNDYARLRFGVGNDYPKGRQVDYVLSNFKKDEMEALPERMAKAAEMALSLTAIGIGRTMSQFNE